MERRFISVTFRRSEPVVVQCPGARQNQERRGETFPFFLTSVNDKKFGGSLRTKRLRMPWFPSLCSLYRVHLVTREENGGSRPNRMETRFLEIAYRKFTEGIGLPVRDLTNELSTYSNWSSRIEPPVTMRKKERRERKRCSANYDDNDQEMFHGKTEFHKPDLLIPSRISDRRRSPLAKIAGIPDRIESHTNHLSICTRIYIAPYP